MNSLYLVVPLLYSVFVVAICAFLIVRGFTHAFLLLFGIAAVLHTIPPLGFALLQAAPSGLGGNMRWMPALSFVGMIGTICSVAAFLSLASYLLGTRNAGANASQV